MARIGDRRRARVAYERDLRALLEFDHDFRGARDFVVLVIADEPLLDFEVREQLHRLARVFAGDHVHFLQDAQGAQRNVLEIADGRRDHVQAARCRRQAGGVGTLRFRILRFRACDRRQFSTHSTVDDCRPASAKRSRATISVIAIRERSFPLPLYEYKCTKCGHRFEKIENDVGFGDEEVSEMRSQGGTADHRTCDSVQGLGLVRDRLRRERNPASDSSERSGDGSASRPQENARRVRSPSSRKSTDTKSAESKPVSDQGSSEKGSSKKKK